jgi:hypothetical protein
MRIHRGVSLLKWLVLPGVTAVVTLALVVGFAGIAFGQSATGAITGTLTDAQGAAMVGASVAVRNTATGVEKNAMSNDAGIYNAPLCNREYMT